MSKSFRGDHLITLKKMNSEEFKTYAQFSYENYLAETARSSGKEVHELREKLGGPPKTIRENDLWLLVKNGDKDIGFLWVEIKPNREAFGWDIYLNEDCRSQGIGREVMLSVGQTLSEHNVNKVQICVVEGNAIARKLYESLGFKEINFNETHKRYTLEISLQKSRGT